MDEPDAAAAAAPVRNDLRDFFDMAVYSLVVFFIFDEDFCPTRIAWQDQIGD